MSAIIERSNDLRTEIPAIENLVLQSGQMQQLWALMQNTAGTKANVLITGETGVGKTAIARAIHQISNRAQAPFITINCAVLNENLIESELFGYEKGAFTGASSTGKSGKIELSNHGTLFMDEIGELSLRMQSKLLQVIQEKTIERLSGNRRIELDFRLIVATNKDLEDEVRNGVFRSDLFYRLNVIRIHIPALRNRREDIVPMAVRFLAYFNRAYAKACSFSPRFLILLEQCDWPGNVRELENLIERLVITVRDSVIDIGDLTPGLSPKHVLFPDGTAASGTLAERVEAAEGEIIRECYRRNGTTVAVARELGISQATASRKVAKYR